MLLKNKTVLVTGGAGFIGSNLVKRLVKEGAIVSVVDNLWRGNLENLMVEGEPVIDLESRFILKDLTDFGSTLEVVRNFDYVYHLADIVAGIAFTFENEHYIFRQNMLINSNVIQACLINGIKNLIYVGTACSYPKSLQMQEGIVRLVEDQVYPAEPESGYGWSKLMGEYECELAQKSGLNVGLLRFHNVYGPGVSFDEKRSQVIPALILKVINAPEQPFVVWGSGNQYRDFVYIDDIVESLLLVAEKGMNQGAIQIGSEEAVSIRDLAFMLVEMSGKDLKPEFDLSKPEGDRGRIADCSKARQVLGWQPKVKIQEGLKNTYQWIEKELNAKH